MLTLLVFLVVISLLVLVHELGHFLSARRLGVSVEEFGFGFPPRLFGIRRKGTIFSINWIPFGGFVKMKGETPGTVVEPDSFSAQSPIRRLAILAAGVLMNYALTIVLLTIGFTAGLPSVQDPNSSTVLQNVRPQVIEVEPDGPAANAGVRPGDIVLRANDVVIDDAGGLKNFQRSFGATAFSLSIERDGQAQTLMVTPVQPTPDVDPKIGVAILNIGLIKYPFPESLWEGTRSTLDITGQIFSSFGGLLRDLVVDRKVSQDLSGPVGIVVLTGQAFELGFVYLLQFVALLSATLAVFNFLPFPALDGGRALFVLIESLRGRAMNQRVESAIHAVGFYVLIALVLLVSLRDVGKFQLGERVVDGLKNLFGG